LSANGCAPRGAWRRPVGALHDARVLRQACLTRIHHTLLLD
jgi:hypothetical protein